MLPIQSSTRSIEEKRPIAADSLNQRFSVAKRSFSGQVLCLRRIGEEQNHRRPKGRRCLHFGPDHQEGSLSPRRKYLGPPLRVYRGI